MFIIPCSFNGDDQMHNLMSYNQLADWTHTNNNNATTHDQLLDEYYECLIECDETQQVCKSICKEILV